MWNGARGIELESDAEYANDSIAGADPVTLGASGTSQVGTIAGTIMDRQSTNFDEDYFSFGFG